MYFKNRDIAQKKLSWDPLDIEELHKAAKKECFCPYFAMRDRLAGADVVFMPYNYLIDEKIRENFELNIENSVVIFDEGHNIPSVCED
jgi:regulator of telomere elongation helicase 1